MTTVQENSSSVISQAFAKKCRRKALLKKHAFIWTMLAGPIVCWFIFYLYTNLNMIVMAFQTPKGAWTWQNFVSFWDNLSATDGSLRIAVWNTFLYFLLANAVILPIGTLIAYFLYKKVAGYKFFRVAIFLPSIIPGVVMVTVFKEIISPVGPLGKTGWIPSLGFLGQDSTATPTVLFYTFWTGFSSIMLLMSGTMARIPTEVMEAAKLDGCGPFREFRSLVIPLIFPTLTTQLIFGLTGLFSSSGPILLMTGGAHKTTTLSYWIFENVYGSTGATAADAYNIVSATGLVFTVSLFPIILLVRFLVNKVDAVEY